MKLYNCFFHGQEAEALFKALSVSDDDICPYTNQKSNYVELEECADTLTEFFRIFVESSDGVSLAALLRKDWDIFNFQLEGCESFINDVLDALEINLTSETLVAYRDDVSQSIRLWEELKEALMFKQRFFLPDRLDIIEDGWDTKLNASLQSIDERNVLYRARIHERGQLTAFPETEMSAPPPENTPDGRANPAGIPVLYLCQDVETAVHEARAILNDVLSIGIFTARSGERLKLVDFSTTPSIFNDFSSISAGDALLMRYISRDLSTPMRRFSPKTEYIPTQFICEFIRERIGADGIRFRSSLRDGGINVVLFNPSKVSCIRTMSYIVNNYGLQVRPI